MPYIDCAFAQSLTEDKKEKIKSGLGKAVSILSKPESYLMVGIADGRELWFGGKKLDNGAYVSVSLFGSASSAQYERMTAEICRLLEAELGTSPSHVYVTYHGVNDWGWNGGNF